MPIIVEVNSHETKCRWWSLPSQFTQEQDQLAPSRRKKRAMVLLYIPQEWEADGQCNRLKIFSLKFTKAGQLQKTGVLSAIKFKCK